MINDSTLQKPLVSPSGLITVAYLKARLDEGKDHIGIFFAFVVDLLQRFPSGSFTAQDVQSRLEGIHGISMPETVIGTLLKRAAKRNYIIREAGRYSSNSDCPLPVTNVEGQKESIQEAQQRLGDALREHARSKGLDLGGPGDALDLLLKFLEEQHVAVLLSARPDADNSGRISRRECLIMAEFLHDISRQDVVLKNVLTSILEGLVVYQSTFLTDLSAAGRGFKDLTVIFDSVLVRQAAGYEGVTAQKLIREIIELLRTNNVRCCMFDKSVQEIQRLLSLYENKLATADGRRSLHPVPMARYFLSQRFSPSDVQEMEALLEQEIESVGIRIISTPPRRPEYTYSEEKLASLAVRLVVASSVRVFARTARALGAIDASLLRGAQAGGAREVAAAA